MRDVTDYGLPGSPVAEKAVLGCLILDGLASASYCLRLRPEMFQLDSHQRIYRVLEELTTDGIEPNYILVADALKRRSELDAVGGIPYIMDLGTLLPRHFDPSRHIDEIIETWKLRQGLTICDRYQSRFAALEPSDEILSAMQSDVFDAMQETNRHDDPLVAAYSAETVAAFEAASTIEKNGLTYGSAKLDAFSYGMQDGEVTVIGARSGVGKSSLLCQAVAANCANGVAVDVFSLEMSRKTMLHRLWSIVAQVPFFKIHRPICANIQDREYIKAAAAKVASWPLRIYDDGDMSLSHIISSARLSMRKNDCRILAVDYAQNVNAPGRDEREKVTAVSRTLTKLVKNTNTHLLLLSQLRKQDNQGGGRAPNIGDLRETGQLENDAHIVALLHRPWDEDAGSLKESGEFIIPKQRNGKTGTLEINFNSSTLTFE